MQINKSTRIFVFDPCFGNMTGHWENYCKRFCQELTERGYEVLVFGQAQPIPSIVQGVNFEPTFTTSPYDHAASLLDMQRTADKFTEDFKRIDESRFCDSDIFMFHSIFPQSFAAIMDWTTELVRHKNIKVTFCFQFPPSESKFHVSWKHRIKLIIRRLLHGEMPTGRAMEWVDNNFVRFYQKKIRMLRNMHNKSHILMANTNTLADNFSGLFGMKVYPLPMPGENITDSKEFKPFRKDSHTIKIGYFGHASLEKGGQYLKGIVDKTLEKFPQVEFLLHINPNKDTEDYLRCFKEIINSKIACYHGHLEKRQMMELIKEVDIVLMPYSPSKYATTPSAIFTEGLNLKKVFIIPERTWIEEQALQYEVGVSKFASFTEEAIIQAAFEAILNFQQLVQKSEKASEMFYEENNMVNYINTYEALLHQHAV